MLGTQFPCPIEKAQEILGKKWAILIIRDIMAGKSRFTDILNANKNLSTRMLALRLRELEESEFIEKIIASKTPLMVKYVLTRKGFDTRRILLELAKFSLSYHPDFEMKQNEKIKYEDLLENYFG